MTARKRDVGFISNAQLKSMLPQFGREPLAIEDWDKTRLVATANPGHTGADDDIYNPVTLMLEADTGDAISIDLTRGNIRALAAFLQEFNGDAS